MSERHDEPEPRVVIRDNRKIDPETGQVRRPAQENPAPAAAKEDAVSTAADPGALGAAAFDAVAIAEAQHLVAERTADLQRLQAEYANYRKRAERDRVAAGDLAVGRVLHQLLPIVDDLDRARDHGDLTGALKAVADKLDEIAGKLGLVAFGEPGDPFDPAIHEAVLHDERPDVLVPTATTVMRKGYQHNDKLLRPAMVGVSDPSSAPLEPVSEAPGEGTAQRDDAGTNPPPTEDEGGAAHRKPTA